MEGQREESGWQQGRGSGDRAGRGGGGQGRNGNQMGQSSASAHSPLPPPAQQEPHPWLQSELGELGSLLPASRQPCPSCLGSSSPPYSALSGVHQLESAARVHLVARSDPGLQAKSFGSSSCPSLSVKPGVLRPCSVLPAWSLCTHSCPSCPDPPPSPILPPPPCLSPRLPFSSLHDV